MVKCDIIVSQPLLMSLLRPEQSFNNWLRVVLIHRFVIERPKLSDPAHGTQRLQPRRPRRVRCSAWLENMRADTGRTRVPHCLPL